MRDQALPADVHEYVAPSYLRGLALFALSVTPLLALLSFLAWWVEGAMVGLVMIPLWLGMVAYWWWQWRIWAQRFHLFADRLVVQMPGRAARSVFYPDLCALQLARDRLQLTTRQTALHLRGDPNTLAQLTAALEQQVPALRMAREAPPVHPIHVKAPRQPVIILNLFGLLIGALGMGLGNAAWRDGTFPDRTLALFFAGVMLAIGAIFLYWLLVAFVWRYTFDRDAIRVRHTLYSVRYDPTHLRRITLEQRDVTHRGFTKTLYTLRLDFAQGAPLIVQPGAQNYPFDYADVYEQVGLTRLRSQLEQLYAMVLNPIQPPAASAVLLPAVTTRRLDPKAEWQSPPGLPAQPPAFLIEHHSQPADLRVTILNYGERQPGAETVLLYLSRPVAGHQIFATTNGDAAFSASGAYLLLSTPFLLVAIDAHTRQAWHYVLPNRTMLLNAGWEGERLVGKLVGYGKSVDAATTIGPYTWAELTAQWQPGLGRAATFTPKERYS
ncbi:MAG: hypothetical protein R3E79_59475 [Caldilineaceae bacterium]